MSENKYKRNDICRICKHVEITPPDDPCGECDVIQNYSFYFESNNQEKITQLEQENKELKNKLKVLNKIDDL